MVNKSIIETTALGSPLLSVSQLNPKRQSGKKTLVATVLLTSLIDAFSILVIYLLVNFSNSGEILYLSKDMELPMAKQSESLVRSTLVKVENGQFFIEDEPVKKTDLVAVLIDKRKELASSQTAESKEDPAITIQSDRRVKYKLLNQAVLASSQAGFSEIRFAVLAN